MLYKEALEFPAVEIFYVGEDKALSNLIQHRGSEQI